MDDGWMVTLGSDPNLVNLLIAVALGYHNPAEAGLEVKGTKEKLRQPSQQEGTKTASLPQSEHIESGD
ncbi:hypothetical protein L873DRAFT_1804480 [Choiromyces venosus 120613-1]|uniref:Uncharacterized protein n=1 Tax=Choiromyces venosus 120613-1 TaxID=1336337 RepID=A0A3N4JRE0_9PEZI|nr:hypothetical protein L873DRAFT_1804480 [Choiromyces venosus 120613-1]